MRVLVAMDKFKGTATSAELGAAVVTAVRGRGAVASFVVVSDGGDGLLDVFGGANRTSTVTGPLGRPLVAQWRLDEDGTAVVESARACGITLAGGSDGNDAMAATSAGVGELVAAAVRAGARQIVVGVGGSACTDGGIPAVDALGDTAAAITAGDVSLLVCCDVFTRYEDAAAVFAPQKGATPHQVVALGERLRDARAQLRDRFGRDIGEVAGGGAAGGLAGGLAAVGGSLRRGFDVVAGHVGLDEAVAACDLVITGEGRLDRTSFDGKVVGGVVGVARRHDVDVVAIVGEQATDVDATFAITSLVERFGARRAHDDVLACVADVTRELVPTMP